MRVELSGKDTQKAFDTVVRSLAKNAPPVPGFRKAKGGKLFHDNPQLSETLIVLYNLE